MRARGANWPAELLLALGCLLLVGLQASQAANVTVTQESGLVREAENESKSEVYEEAEKYNDVPENETPAEPEEEGEGSGSLGTGGP